MLHEVNFELWCPKCEHYPLAESEDPCHDCLNQPVNDDSRKPVMYKDAGTEGTKNTVGTSGMANTAATSGTVVRTTKRKLTITGKPI